MEEGLRRAADRVRHPRTWWRTWWGARPLRTKLVVMITALMMILVAVIALVTAVLFRTELVRQLDEDMETNRDAVSVYLTSMAQTGGYYSPQHSILRFYGVVWDTRGDPVVSTPLLPGTDGPALAGMTTAEVDAVGSGSFEVPGTQPGSDGWRVQLYHLRSGEGSLAIALPLHSVTTSVSRVVTLVVSIWLIGTAASVIVANLLVERAFRTLDRVERTTAKIAAGDLTQRVASAPPSTEVGRLSRSINAMLAHIESAFRDKEVSEDKMRRFVQDASHELRTPLVTIRGFSELYRHGGITEPEDVAAAMGRIESEAGRMHRLVEDLLTLARLDEQRPLDHAPVDLLVLGMDAMMDASVNAPERRVTLVGLDGGPAVSAPLMGDENRLRQVVVNLVTNALRYTPEGTPIEVAVGTRDLLTGADAAASRQSVVEVRDHGDGVSAEDAERIFERFYRADASRHRETGGTGLGLAIVAAIVAQHGGSVRLLETEGGGATFSVALPWVPFEEDDDEGVEDAEGTTDGSGSSGDPDDGDHGPGASAETAQWGRLARAGEMFRRASAARRGAAGAASGKVRATRDEGGDGVPDGGTAPAGDGTGRTTPAQATDEPR